MSPILRTWLAFAAIGAGLIHVALVVGAPPWAAVLLGMLGITEFVWGAIAFSREAVPLPRVALVVATAPALLWVAGLVSRTVPASLSPLSLGVATLFTLFVATVLGIQLRRPSTPSTPGAGTYLLGLAVGAIVVIALTLPALAATVVGGGAPIIPLPFDEHGHTR